MSTVVFLMVGFTLGLRGERWRRSKADRKSTKATFEKAHKAMITEYKKAGLAYFLFLAFLAAIVVGFVNYPR